MIIWLRNGHYNIHTTTCVFARQTHGVHTSKLATKRDGGTNTAPDEPQHMKDKYRQQMKHKISSNSIDWDKREVLNARAE